METPENTVSDHHLRCVGHMARAYDVGYATVQELTQLLAELAPYIAEGHQVFDDAYVHTLAALRAAYTATHHVTALAAVMDRAGWTNESLDRAEATADRLQLVHPAGSAIGVGF